MTPSRRPIQRLSPRTIGRIAAGEVVERPASVVKELVENAVDAGATSIGVRIDGGGLEGIVVADDGAGIPEAELALAVERHATSKLADDEPLEEVGTLGFRGEALHAIGQVARLVLLSRTDGDDAAHGIEIADGELPRRFVGARARGTTVTVTELFRSVPARRKFLRSPASEQVEITGTLDRLYLARTGLAIRLESAGREVLAYPAVPSVADAAGRVLGAEFAAHAFAVHLDADGVGITGWLGRPPLSRSSSAGLFLAVNGRTVVSRELAASVRAAFVDYLPRVRFPVGVLHLTLPTDRVDPNVDPTKRSVRLARAAEVGETLRQAVRGALRELPQESARPWPTEVTFPERSLPGGARRAEPVAPPAAGGAGPRQSRLDPPGARTIVPAGPRHPPLTLLGCVGDLYWAAADGADLVLIDQHAASERLLYDELLRSGHLARQELVSPVRIELTPRQAETLRSASDRVRAGGFVVAPFGADAWRVHAVPAYRGHTASAEELPRLLEELADGGRPSVPDGLVERVTASLACHAAVRAGDRISSERMGSILEGLYALTGPALACPHGRPILIRLPRGRLDGWFGRSGP
ncbi:MAG: DNA mismatch repair endonuclease MutL [Thermoplasmata archaeon]